MRTWMQGFISLSILRKDSKMYSWRWQCHHLQRQLPHHILGFCLNLNPMACPAGSCSHYMCCDALSHDQLFATLWTVACQAPLSMGFSRQEYWSGLLCPPPGDLPDPGIESMSVRSPALVGGLFTISTPWEVHPVTFFPLTSSFCPLILINMSYLFVSHNSAHISHHFVSLIWTVVSLLKHSW